MSFKHDMNSVKRPEDPTSGGPVRVAFLAAGFNFAAGQRVVDVPYDPRTPFLFDVRTPRTPSLPCCLAAFLPFNNLISLFVRICVSLLPSILPRSCSSS